ncbi:MAG: D-tyrosyl-tRNA(Tyr) deacylase [Candidatus Omnitrophica bacterium]|nr:D-tyrosyl-tRNA(Tyr) deacylase [Candidatus Omnitrophota bacterium]
MRAVIQRVTEAKVFVGERLINQIGKGLLVFLGIGKEDTKEDADFLAKRLKEIRIFNDENKKMSLSLEQIKREALVVSEVTLFADLRKGRTPSFEQAKEPVGAGELYDYFIAQLEQMGVSVKGGQFAAMMDVYLVNDGPVTIILDTKNLSHLRGGTGEK